MNKIVKALIGIIILNLCSFHVFAQPEGDKETQDKGGFTRFIQNEKVAVKIEYFGELVLHPGLSIGIDYTLTKKKWVDIHWDTEIGGYWHRWNNTALFLKSSVGARFPISFMFLDFNLGAGYMHSFPAGIIYQRASDGSVEKAVNWGHSHFMPTFSVLVGYGGTRENKLPYTIHVGVEAYLQSSFNHTFLPHTAAKIGITYNFRNK